MGCQHLQKRIPKIVQYSFENQIPFFTEYEIVGEQPIEVSQYRTVYKTAHRFTRMIRIVQVYKREQEGIIFESNLKRHNKVLIRLDCPFITKVHGVFSWQQFISFIKDEQKGVNLRVYKDKLKEYESEDRTVNILLVIKMLIQAVLVLQKSQVFQININPENIIIDAFSKVVKIIDVKPQQQKHQRLQEVLYYAPQQVAYKHSLKSPVWSIGVIFHFLCFGVQPVKAQLIKACKDKLQANQVQIKQHPVREINKLIRRMLTPDISQRIGLEQCLSLPLFKQIKKKVSMNQKKKKILQNMIQTANIDKMYYFYGKFVVSRMFDSNEFYSAVSLFLQIAVLEKNHVQEAVLKKLLLTYYPFLEVQQFLQNVKQQIAFPLSFTDFRFLAVAKKGSEWECKVQKAFKLLNSQEQQFINRSKVLRVILKPLVEQTEIEQLMQFGCENNQEAGINQWKQLLIRS